MVELSLSNTVVIYRQHPVLYLYLLGFVGTLGHKYHTAAAYNRSVIQLIEHENYTSNIQRIDEHVPDDEIPLYCWIPLTKLI